MKNLVFTLWLLLFPLMDSLSGYIDNLSGKKNDKDESKHDEHANLLLLLFYFLVAFLLYEK